MFIKNISSAIIALIIISNSLISSVIADEIISSASSDEQIQADEGINYPLLENNQSVKPLNQELFRGSKIEYPINTGFESISDFQEMLDSNSNLSISENSYSGKFALNICQDANKTSPIVESELFPVAKKENVYSALSFFSLASSSQGSYEMNVEINDKTLIVSGKADANREIAILVTNDSNKISYVNQMTSNANGYSFTFSLAEYGTYTIKIGGVSNEAYTKTIEVNKPDNDLPKEQISDATNVTPMTNVISFWVKPMYKAESISFYTKAMVNDENGDRKEKYVLIKSDSNNDGTYKIGNDLSQGAWQQVSVNLLDIDEELADNEVSGIYCSANRGSQWVIDDVSSSCFEEFDNYVDLSSTQSGNVDFSNEGLKFVKNSDGTKFTSSSETPIFQTHLDKKISGIHVDSVACTASSQTEQPSVSGEKIVDIPFSSDKWSCSSSDFTDEYAILGLDETLSVGTEIETQKNERTTVHLEAEICDTIPTVSPTLSFKILDENNIQVYETYVSLEKNLDKQALKIVAPKAMPYAKYVICNTSSDIIKISSFDVSMTCSYDTEYIIANTDKNVGILSGYSSSNKPNNTDLVLVSNIVNENNSYAVAHPNISGIRSTAGAVGQITVNANSFIKYINMSTEKRQIQIGAEFYPLMYGENDLFIKNGGYMQIPDYSDFLLIGCVTPSTGNSNDNNVPYFYVDGLSSSYTLSEDGNTIYYPNYYDHSKIYSYNFLTEEYKKVIDEYVSLKCFSGNNLCVYEKDGLFLYNLETGESEKLDMESYNNVVFSKQNEIMYVEYISPNYNLKTYRNNLQCL